MTAPSVLDQDPSHGLGRRGEEVAATVPGPIGIAADQPQVRFMDQGRGLERLPGRLPRQPLRGQPPQLVVDQREQLASRPRLRRAHELPRCEHSRRDRLRWVPSWAIPVVGVGNRLDPSLRSFGRVTG